MVENPVPLKKKVPDRSPRYPSIPLRRAIERAREFYRAEGKHAAQSEVAVTHWGYTAKSSGGKLTLAALRAYGLLENVGGGVKLSDRALRIILDEREPSPERVALIREAALSPAIHRKLWDKYKADLPSPASLRHALLMEFEFADNAVNDFVREYKETLAFAGLDGSASMEAPEEAKSSAPPPTPAPVQVGDLVNWESLGVLQNAQPLRIYGFSEDGAFAFVEGSGTGLPVSQLTRIEGAERTSPMVNNPAPVTPAPPQGGTAVYPLPPLPPPAPGFKQDVFSLLEGDVTLRWPEGLTKENFPDFQDWLEVMQKKIARAVGAELKQK